MREQLLQQLMDSLADVNEAVEDACEDDAEPEDISEAHHLAWAFLDRYQDLLDDLGPEQRCRLQQCLGLRVQRLKCQLTRLALYAMGPDGRPH